ncbi:probable 2-oxoglutarate-dependent dioxygenase AOP1 [Rutidosis leptorrhynchoides]|uniref:probable 2-oxoglutarate-dependent dioxygenase AOP1 n=1 Tax=Rutidosis leptorrhynchoides TaxID=125765 RepID=UPI003A995487
MGTKTQLKIPFVDFSNIYHDDTTTLDWDLTKSQVHRSLEEFGCFETSIPNILPELQTSVIESLQQVFDLPLETKFKNRSSKPFHGYVGQWTNAPLFESLGIEELCIPDKIENFTKTMWPEGNSKVSNTLQEFSEKLLKLDQMVRKMVLQILGLGKYMDEHMDSAHHRLRFMKYKGPETNESKVGLKAHTDKGFVSILHQNQVEGLEVQTKSGDWIKVQPSHNLYIVMIADSLVAWINGRLFSPFHQVMMTGEKARYSVGLFSFPKASYVIKAPEETVDDENPLLFKPFEYLDFLEFYSIKEGLTAQSTQCLKKLLLKLKGAHVDKVDGFTSRSDEGNKKGFFKDG